MNNWIVQAIVIFITVLAANWLVATFKVFPNSPILTLLFWSAILSVIVGWGFGWYGRRPLP